MGKKELLDKINGLVAEVRELVAKGDIEGAQKAKDELQKTQKLFDLINDLPEETPAPQPAPAPEDVHPADGPKDAIHEFAEAARHRFHNAAGDASQEGVDADGGYTVPQDIQTRINRYRESHFSLFSLVDTENVTTISGRRTYQTRAQHKGFSKVAEMGKIGKMSGPQFETISYTIEKYAGYLPVTNELLADSDANIANTLIEWLGEEDIATRNNLTLAILNALAAKAITDLDGIKKIINVTLGQLFAPYSTIVTNDDGLNWLDTLKDNNKQYVLKPNQNQQSPFDMHIAVGARVIPVLDVPNDILTSDTTKTEGKTIIPFYIGDFKEGIKIFDRQKLSIKQSDTAAIGDFNAFEQDMTLFRGIERLDIKQKDTKAIVKATLTV